MAARRLVVFAFPFIIGLGTACRAANAQHPPRVVDDWGRAVQLVAPARRIVSLSPGATELTFALGLGDRLVGRTHWCDYPTAALAVPDLGNGIGPNVEAVAARRPDLVLLYASPANREALARLESLHIPVVVQKLDLSGDLARAARSIGVLAGAAAAADSFARRFEDAIVEAAHREGRSGGAVRRLKVYVDVEPNPPITIGAGSYLTEILEAAGGVNAFADIRAPSATVSLEAIAARDPDAILVLSSRGADAGADLARRPGWSTLRAVRRGRIVVVDPSLYGRPSPRMPQAIRDLSERLARMDRQR